jgi:5'-3' exonuclease
MRELMNQPFSPLIDFYPQDFGLDLNGKRFTWQAVILLPFIDEPRLVRILAPLLKRLTPNEKVRNRRGVEIIFGHKDDQTLGTCVTMAQQSFEAGQAGSKTSVRDRAGGLFGYLEGYQAGGANRTITSPIEGLPDVDESHAMSAQFFEPEHVPHYSKLLPGIFESKMVVNASDMDEQARMKGFGGDSARRMIMQALGKSDHRPRYKNIARQVHEQAAAKAYAEPDATTDPYAGSDPYTMAPEVTETADEPAHWDGEAEAEGEDAAAGEEPAADWAGDEPGEFDAFEAEAAEPPVSAPPTGARVIKVLGKKKTKAG